MFLQEHSSDTTDTPSISAHVFVVVKLAARALRQPEDQAWLGQLAAKHGVAFTIGSQFWGVLFRANAQPSATVEQIKLAIISRYGNSAIIRSRLTTENLSNKSLSLSSEEPLPTALRKMMLELV